MSGLFNPASPGYGKCVVCNEEDVGLNDDYCCQHCCEEIKAKVEHDPREDFLQCQACECHFADKKDCECISETGICTQCYQSFRLSPIHSLNVPPEHGVNDGED
jgi:hypothetical protein